jgi:hypothetical protein
MPLLLEKCCNDCAILHQNVVSEICIHQVGFLGYKLSKKFFRDDQKGRGQKAGGRRNTFDMQPTTERSKGIKPPLNVVHWLPFRRGLNPLVNGIFWLLPSFFCLLQLSI